MAANKRTATEREEALAEVAKWDRRGASARDIARRMNVSHTQVNYDLKIIRKRYAESTLLERGAAIQEKISQLREVREQAWAAWEHSKENRERSVKEKVTEGGANAGQQAERLKVIMTTEGRLPENAYLLTVLKTLEDEANLLDLFPAKDGNNVAVVVTVVGGIDLAAIVGEKPGIPYEQITRNGDN
jgi:hypothetical protein